MAFRLKENIIVREVDDKIIFYDSEKMIFYGLKGALATYIVQEKELEISQMVSYLLKVYDVDDKTATEDATYIINDLVKNEIIEKVDI